MSFRFSFPLLALLLGLFSLFAVRPMQAQTTVSLSVSPNPILEGETLTLLVTLSQAVSYPDTLAIPFVTTAGTAEPGEFPFSDGISFVPTSQQTTISQSTGTFNLPVDLDNDDETFTVALGTLPSGYVAGSPSSIEVTIKDNYSFNVSLSYAKGRFREGSSTSFWVELDRPRPSPVTIPLIASAITAESGDYSAPSSITIPAGVTKVSGTVTANQDTDTDDETFNLGIGATSLSVGVLDTAYFTIIDDDAGPTVTLSATPNPVDEGSEVTITATLSAALESSVGIPVRIRQGTAEFLDVGMVDNITIAAGETTGTTSVRTAQDVDFDDETFSVYVPQYHLDQMNLSSSVWVTAGAGSSVQITIKDGDGTGDSLVQRRSVVTEGTTTVTLSATTIVVEGSPYTITVTLSKALSSAVTIPLQKTDQSYESGDLEEPPSQITIAAGQATGMVTLETYQDTETPEEDEFIDVALGNNLPSGLVAGSVTQVRISILDDDRTLPNVYFSDASWNPIEEGSSVTVTVSISKPLAQSVTIPLLLRSGFTRHHIIYNAEPGDYSAPSSITIPANQTSATFTLSAWQDDDRDDERLLLSFGSLPASVTPILDEIKVIILDDDNLELTLSAEKTSVTEGESVLITMTFTEPVPLQPNQSVLIPIRVLGIDTEPGDIRSPSSFGIRVDGGMTSQSFFLGTGIDGDSDDDTFRVALDTARLPDWVYAGDPESVVITIEEYQPETQTPLDLSTPLVEGLSSEANLSVLAETSQSRGTFVIFSTRAVAGTEEERMMGVFVIEDDPKTVLVQAQGPELANPPSSLSNVLADPVLTVIRQSDGKQLVVNDDWEDNQKQDVTDVWAGSPNLDAGSKSSAAILTLQPGSYSVIVSGKNGATGIVRVEVYDLD